MAGHDDGASNYDDDDLDDLPSDALVELENNAIQFTQAQRVKAAPSSDYGDDFEDEDLDDAVVIDESRSTPAIVPTIRQTVPGPAIQHAQFRQQRYGMANNSNLANRQRYSPPPKFNESSRLPSGPIVQHADKVEEGTGEQAAGPDVLSLQRQVEELLRERNALKEDLNAKAGEIAIVRSKQEKTVKEYEREMAVLRKLNEDKLAKQQKSLEAARIAEKNAATERDFIKQDLAEESERVRRLNRQKAAEKKDGPSAVTTPKKKKTFSHRDGFDDDEIEILSPSKISPSKFQKRNIGSPSKPGKRKRKAAESPAGALEVIQIDEPSAVVPDQKATVLDEAIIASLQIQDDRFDFIGTILDHRIDSNHLRTLEELGKHSLPSAPKESFQSIILGRIPELGVKKSSKDLPIDFCELLVSIWKSCLEEKYYKPIYLFMDMLSFALELKTSLIAPHIIDSLVPVTQLTADLMAIPRFKRWPLEEFENDIDLSVCMSILYLAAQGCTSCLEHITRFWKLFRYDFILMLLSTNQQQADFMVMLQLLSTSVFRDSFGAIHVDVPQDRQISWILDRFSYILYEVPSLPMSNDKFDVVVLSKMRIQILQLLTSMTRSPFASKAVAIHPLVIGRLVSLISDELDLLYDYQPRHEESALIISLAVRLLYHLVTRYDNMIDMQKKLAVIPGGSQKHLLCLSRLSFSEDNLVLESGIGADVAQCAMDMLDMSITPEEGEAVQSAFTSP